MIFSIVDESFCAETMDIFKNIALKTVKIPNYSKKHTRWLTKGILDITMLVEIKMGKDLYLSADMSQDSD